MLHGDLTHNVGLKNGLKNKYSKSYIYPLAELSERILDPANRSVINFV